MHTCAHFYVHELSNCTGCECDRLHRSCRSQAAYANNARTTNIENKAKKHIRTSTANIVCKLSLQSCGRDTKHVAAHLTLVNSQSSSGAYCRNEQPGPDTPMKEKSQH